MNNESLYKQVETNIDHLAANGVWWSNCATEEQMKTAIQGGNLELTLGNRKPVPREWITDIIGKKVLCLAGGGGFQAPLLAAVGADVTVMDLSMKMLEKDVYMAEKYALNIRIEQGNMTDLSRFENDSFDYVINPASLFYVPSVHPVFKECYRVLNKGGILIIAAPNPIAYICDFVEHENGGYYKAVNKMPYSSTEHSDQDDWIEFGHTMQDYIGGQIDCGFVITGYVEDQGEDITDLTFMTKAIKQ